MVTVNQVEYREENSDSLLNHDRYCDLKEILEFHRHIASVDQNSVKALKSMFGPQLTTRQYTSRNWIWTFDVDGFVVYLLASKEGVSFECDWSTIPQNHKEFKSKFDQFASFVRNTLDRD